MATFTYPPIAVSATIAGANEEATQLLVKTAVESIAAEDFATQTTLAAIDAKLPALSGGSVPVVGPLTDAELRATAVPVSGPVTDAELRASALPVSAASLPLPSGAATEATLAAASAKLPAALGSTTAANSLSVALASNQVLPLNNNLYASGSYTAADSITMSCNGLSTIKIIVTGTWTGGIMGSTTNDTVYAGITALNLDDGIGYGTATTNGIYVFDVTGVKTFKTDFTVDTGTMVVDVVGSVGPSYLAGIVGKLRVGGDIRIQTSDEVLLNAGQQVMAASLPVVLASDQPALSVASVSSATATLANVASSATSVTLLASNANRKNAVFFNDSTAVLYLKFGATASTSSYTVQIAANGYYELPVGKIYTGIIDGIWASANGNARVTELT